jgi:curved DNA-binding protein CbpA
MSSQKLIQNNLYQILGVPADATKQVIRTAYIKLAKKYHPDSVNGGDVEKFKIVNNAYETLSDDVKRQAYDSNLKNAQNINYQQREAYAYAYRYGYTANNAHQKQNVHKGWNEAYAEFAGTWNGAHSAYNAQQAHAENIIRMKKCAFSDAQEKKKAAEEDVNYKNSYARFYKEWFHDEVTEYQRTLIRRRAGVHNFARSQHIYESIRDRSFVDESKNAKESEEDHDVKKKAYILAFGDNILLIVLAVIIIGKLIKSGEKSVEEGRNTNEITPNK